MNLCTTSKFFVQNRGEVVFQRFIPLVQNTQALTTANTWVNWGTNEKGANFFHNKRRRTVSRGAKLETCIRRERWHLTTEPRATELIITKGMFVWEWVLSVRFEQGTLGILCNPFLKHVALSQSFDCLWQVETNSPRWIKKFPSVNTQIPEPRASFLSCDGTFMCMTNQVVASLFG